MRAFALIVTGCLAGSALGSGVATVVHSTAPTSDTSLVPGLNGARFTRFGDVNDGIAFSPNGQHWVVRAETDLGLDVLITGRTGEGAGDVILREGDEVSWEPGVLVQGIQPHVDINDSGDLTTWVDTPVGFFFKTPVVYFAETGVLSAIVEYGDEFDDFPGYPSTVVDGASPAQIENSGILSYWISVEDGGGEPADYEDTVLIRNGIVVSQENVDSPAGQFDGRNLVYSGGWGALEMDGVGNWITWTMLGEVEGVCGLVSCPVESSTVLVVNDQVVAQGGFPVGEVQEPIVFHSDHALDQNGNWWLQASPNEPDSGFLMSNGVVRLQAADALSGGFPGETVVVYGGAQRIMSSFATNAHGDFVGRVGTSAPGSELVVLVNGESVALRKGDLVDIDGDGIVDGNASLASGGGFAGEGGGLTDDGVYSFLATIEVDGMLAHALLTMTLGDDGASCPSDVNGDGQTNIDDVVAVVLAWGSADVDADVDESGIVDVDDLVAVVIGWGPCHMHAACCVEGQGCVDAMTQEDCLTSGGTFAADGSDCSTIVCPDPPFACCFESDACELLTEVACIALGGTPEGVGSTCFPNPCFEPLPTGACCAFGVCLPEVNESGCANLGGTFQGEGSTCANVDCSG